MADACLGKPGLESSDAREAFRMRARFVRHAVRYRLEVYVLTPLASKTVGSPQQQRKCLACCRGIRQHDSLAGLVGREGPRQCGCCFLKATGWTRQENYLPPRQDLPATSVLPSLVLSDHEQEVFFSEETLVPSSRLRLRTRCHGCIRVRSRRAVYFRIMDRGTRRVSRRVLRSGAQAP
jgi:hypothetical protein